MSLFSFELTGGEYAELGSYVKRGVPCAAFGLSDPNKYYIASLCEGRSVYITADALSARRAFEAISTLSGKKVVLLPAKDEVLLYRRALSKDNLFRRITALLEWQEGADVLVLDIEATLQLVPKRIRTFPLTVGEETDMRALVSALSDAGYSREYSVDGRGAFSVRGDILDIFPVNAEHPVRIDFFGDEVEAIKPYDEETGERLPKLTNINIAAATDVYLEEGEEERLQDLLQKEIEQAPAAARDRVRDLVESLGEENYRSEFLLPVLSCSTSLFSLTQDALLIFDECKPIRDKVEGLYKEHEERFRRLTEGGEALSFTKNQYLPKESLSFNGRRALALGLFAGNIGFFEPMKLFSFSCTPLRRYLNSLPDLMTDVKAWMKTGYRVLIYCGDERRVEAVKEELSERLLPIGSLPEEMGEIFGVVPVPAVLPNGFLLHECKLAVIGTGDLFTKAPEKRRLRKKRGDLFFAPEVGDFAVHETYGVGRVTGTKRIETTDGVKEYVALEYKDGDCLYVPVEQMDILSKYMGGDNPSLSKIGGGEFERVKTRVRASLKKMAFDLKALYAERQERKGYVFPMYREELDEFAAAFPYEETEDQLVSAEEIFADMCSDKVMDRLLVGDVGFGKTEVALRAVYLCALAGRQAALMCPSTVLSEQHLRTATERMKDFGVRVACLNRFRTEKETKETLLALERGDIDFVIGTHRLLSSDVKFRDLGLLVLDEEQRFGVEHKEKIKNYKRNVDCLTMTATPIPRTLHLSLSGIRDISTIRTPPQERLPVQTYVAEQSDLLLRDAIVREMARGGQVFVLYNRVETIRSFAAHLQETVPEARICVAHGRMEKSVLERSVFGFYRGEYDVLVTTTIIENGIDLPNANTLLVIDSDRLGISQLYQLRGRVGRGARLAHAYFTYQAEKVMTENAVERLKAIMQFTELGSGFKIAMRDLEIRGAGNVLGAEQHGQMDKIGYELYAKILKEELTGVKQESVDLDVKATAYIPESYIESSAGRMDCYKQIAEIRSAADYKRVCLSMEEGYGPLPPETLNLLVIAMMKCYASRLGVNKVTVAQGEASLRFTALDALSRDGIVAAMEKYRARVSLDMTSAPVLRFRSSGDGSATLLAMTKFLKFAATFH